MAVPPYIIKARHLDAIDACGLPPQRVKALREDPFAWRDNWVFQEVGYVNGEEGGSSFFFPVDVKLDGRVYGAVAGGSLQVSAGARRSGLGLELPVADVDGPHSKDGFWIGAAVSQMGLPVHVFNDFTFFTLPRYIWPWHVFPILEKFLRVRILARVLAFACDGALAVYGAVLSWLTRFRLRGLTLVEVEARDDAALAEVADLVDADPARFQELHDARWFRWHLENTFSDTGPARLCVLKREARIVAFCLVKRHFHAVASHRGFKNLWLGSILEWGARPGEEDSLSWLIARCALRFRAQGMDAVAFAVADARLERFVRRLGWRRVGASNFGFRVEDRFPLAHLADELKNPAFWRLRGAMGDNGLT